MKKFFSILLSLAMTMSVLPGAIIARADDEKTVYTEPESPSAVYNMNIDWKYVKPTTSWPLSSAADSVAKDGKQFYDKDYDDSDWETVSVPHQVNASDSFTTLGSNQGDTGQYRGFVFYRKHFTVPSDAAGKKLFIEFEGMDNAAYVWVNGEKVGYYEAGVAAFGFDITDYVTAGEEAVIAVGDDSSCGRGMTNYYKETKPGSEWGSSDGSSFEWNSHEFRPTQAGLVYNVNLYVKGQVYQTLPIYDNLKTTGTYIYADNFDIRSKKATIHVDSEVRNETSADENLTLQVDVVENIDPNEGDDSAENHDKVPYLKYSFTGEGTVSAATDAGVRYETSVKDAYIEEEIDFDTDPDAYNNRPENNDEYDSYSYDVTWGEWTAITDQAKTGYLENGHKVRWGYLDDGEYEETTDVSKATYYSEPLKVVRTTSKHVEVETPDVSHITASFDAEELDFWSTDAPHLYDVYTILKNEAGEVIDVEKTTTGFRKVEYTKDNGLLINDSPVWLTGYAQRSSNEWAAIGAANDWLTDYDMSLVKESNANFIRWMHIAPRVNSVRATDKYGIAVVAPAGDKESDASGRQWTQRTEAMRATMIRFRNSPSVIFWEAGNNEISAIHQKEMTELKAKIDPYGGRFCGCRTLQKEDEIQQAEYVGTMLNRHASTALSWMTSLNKFMPIVETEYHREEGARRVWDDYSPPDYDLDNNYKSDAATQGYDYYDFTSESFAVKDAACYEEFYNDRVNGPSGNNYYTAAAALCWTDSNQHARTTYSENGRMSGRADALRIPKESFYAYQVMQQDDADDETQVHIIGHWSYAPVDDKTREEGGNYYYPIKEQKNGVWVKTGEWGRRDPTNKTVYVVGSRYVSKVVLLVDGEQIGECDSPTNTFIYTFDSVDVTQGDKVEAVAYNAQNKEIGRDEIKRTDDAATIRLTPHTGAEGLLADGSDLMYFDVEVIDEDGNVCPLSYDKINFTLTGDAEFMGGYNSGYATNKKEGWGAGETTVGKSYVYAECGVNRVFVKAGRTAGEITLTAQFDGASIPVSVTINSVEYPAAITGGLTTHRQQELDYGTIVDVETAGTAAMKPLAKTVGVAKSVWDTSDLLYTVSDKNQKDIYTVTINSTELDTTNESYKPDSATGVICDVEPVLAKLKELGADFEYTVGTDEITVKSKKGQNGIDGEIHTFVITKGQTAIGYDGDKEGILTNSQIESENGQLMMEIAALMSYIDGVSTSTDETSKVFEITYSSAE